MKMKQILNIFAGAWLVMNCGCAALLIGVGAGAGVGTVVYIKGELKVTEEIALSQAFNAAHAAMEELEFVITQENKDALTGEVIARTSKDEKIEINLEKKSESLTEVGIRVGTFGDQSLSQLILEKMRSKY
jgi:hypothetical protein